MKKQMEFVIIKEQKESKMILSILVDIFISSAGGNEGVIP